MRSARARSSRVALVHDWLTGMRGGEKVLERLCRRFPAAPIYALFHFPGTVSTTIEEHDIHTSFLQRAPGLRRHYRRYLPLFPAAIESLDLSAYELVVSSSHCVAKGILPTPGATHVCYCHTPMRYAWDQEAAYFPKRKGLGAQIRGLLLSRLRVWDVSTNQRTDCFLANSSFVAQRIRRYYGRDAEVVPPPVDTEFFNADERSEHSDFCLAVAALAPYKRLELAVEACRRANVPLVIVGEGPERRRLERLAGAGVRFPGRVSDNALRQLYRSARCLIQPGVEDFGISAVEALACGTPVVALGQGGVLDVVQDGAHGLLYEPERETKAEIEALTYAIDKIQRVRFNKLDLRSRSEYFSVARFEQRITLVMTRLAERELEAEEARAGR